ncbi:restriction endonuclease subunit S [Streptococcus cristatus]|uniref:restriction endonuclease subunit S n=1 Tax=Streptococcus cristatus TaxID=45634 RepID=UPI001653155E|nr:restriction endonuclease subunit S [Streptococcus cristatus]MBC6976625.1 restriction endonuclease subunit S [Streptococcus cristatus]
MVLTKLGSVIEQSITVNSEGVYTFNDVKGMTIDKEVIPTKAKVKNTDLSKFLIVNPNEFIYNPRTHGKKIGLGFNQTDKPFIISWNNIAFKVKELDRVNPIYLFMYFNRNEWDRKAVFDSWGSSTEVFSWKALCDMEIDLPPLDIQEKYVAIYKAMLANQKAYENGLEDLKLVCDATIEKLQKTAPKQMIGDYIELFDIRNKNNEDFAFKGLSMENYFIDSIANSKGLDFTKYKVVYPNDFAAVLMKVGRDRRITIAQNTSSKNYMISSAYFTFKARETINSDYLMMVMSTTDFDLRCWFNSDSSVRGSLEWGRFCEVEIPIANEGFQNSLANIYKVYLERKEINERLKQQIKDICPILIAGAIKEANANA